MAIETPRSIVTLAHSARSRDVFMIDEDLVTYTLGRTFFFYLWYKLKKKKNNLSL